MFFIRKLTQHFVSTIHFLKSTRQYCFRDKNFDFLRNNTEYKNLVIQMDNNLNVISARSGLPNLTEQDIKAEVFFNNLTQRAHVMKLTASQVKDILGVMANGSIDTTKFALPLKYLDEKCALSASRWPLDASFYVLDAWYNILGPKVFKKHYYTAIMSQWSQKIRKCSKPNLILILYFIGLSKSPPPFLMESVIDRMESMMSQFSDKEMAIACLGFFKCSKKIDSLLFLKHCCKSAENLLNEEDHFNAISILKCLRLSKYYDEELWQFVRNYAVEGRTQFNLVECTNFLALFASENIYDKEIFETLEKQICSILLSELRRDVSELSFNTHPSLRSRVKDYARFLWCMSTVGHPLKENTLNCIAECMGQRLQIKEYETQSHILIDTLQSFVLANYYPANIFSATLNSSVHKKICKSDKAKPKYQLYFVERSVAIEHPNIPICLTNVFHPIPKQIEKEIEERKGFKDVVRLLKQHYPKHFKSCYIMPHIMIAGIFVSRPSRLSDDRTSIYRKYLSEGMITKQIQNMLNSNHEYFCIEILDPSVCTRWVEQPLGLMQTKVRQLKKLNFNVILLTSKDIDNIISAVSGKDNFDVENAIFKNII